MNDQAVRMGAAVEIIMGGCLKIFDMRHLFWQPRPRCFILGEPKILRMLDGLDYKEKIFQCVCQ